MFKDGFLGIWDIYWRIGAGETIDSLEITYTLPGGDNNAPNNTTHGTTYRNYGTASPTAPAETGTTGQ